MKVVTRILAHFLFLSVCFSSISAQDFESLGVFGDNIADPGNIPGILEAANAAGQGPFDTNFPSSPPNFGNRFTNGLVAAEQLPSLLGIDSSQVSNLAVGNAFSSQLPVDLAGGILLGNGSSIPAPIGREITALTSFDIQNQVRNFIASSGPLSEGDLMLVYASANDGALALNTSALLGLDIPSATQVITAGAQVNAANTAASAQFLLDAGASHVVVAALPDIGTTPAAQAGGLAGVVGSTLFSEATNTALSSEVAVLNASGNGVVYVFDSLTLSRDIAANPEKYGFVDASVPCVFSAECASAPVEVQNQFFFWDEFFPTEAGHAVAAAALADTINAPRTIASQAEIARVSSERYARRLLQASSGPNTAQFLTGVDFRSLDRSGELEVEGYEADLTRVDLGGRMPINEDTNLALLIALEEGSIDADNGLSTFDFFAVRLGAAALFQTDIVDLNGSLSVSIDQFDEIERTTGVANQTVRADTDGVSVPLLLEASKQIGTDTATVIPLARLGYVYTQVDDYTEIGAPGLEQIVEDRDTDSLFAELGVEGESFIEGDSLDVRLSAEATYHVALNDSDQSVETALVTIPDVVRRFNVEAPDESYFLVGGGLDVGLGSSGVRVGVRGDAVLDSDIDGFGIRAEIILPTSR